MNTRRAHKKIHGLITQQSQLTQMFTVYCTSLSLMWKSVQANLSGGLPFLMGYHRICAIGGTVAEVASAVVAVADTAPDTVGCVSVSPQVLIALNQIQHSVSCQCLFHFLVQCGVLLEDTLEHSLSNGLDGASKIDSFPHPPSMWVVPVTGWFSWNPVWCRAEILHHHWLSHTESSWTGLLVTVFFLSRLLLANSLLKVRFQKVPPCTKTPIHQ